MPYIKSFRIAALAGRSDVIAKSLNRDINIFFGPNGSGKTSLLRILHSALLQKADLLSEVPFTSSDVSLFSWSEGDVDYHFEKSQPDTSPVLPTRTLFGAIKKPEWQVSKELVPWIHQYLPIARLYEGGVESSKFDLFSTRDDSEMGLEARFTTNLLSTWKDYTAQLARDLNNIQEQGLAQILARVISRTDSSAKDEHLDSTTSYEAVSTFLARRSMEKITPTEVEFKRRYGKEPQFRNLVRDIEEVEKKIATATAPLNQLRTLIREMFIGGKELELKDDAVEVAIAGKKLSLSILSSGEKQLLKILIATVNAGASIILIDEPELSMHVDWQKRLINSMHTLNPMAQLIVATHSPEIMADIPDSKVFQL